MWVDEHFLIPQIVDECATFQTVYILGKEWAKNSKRLCFCIFNRLVLIVKAYECIETF